jgi:hypothetical protein
MKRPKLINSELLLENLVKRTNSIQVIQHIRSLNKYIEFLEKLVDPDDLDTTDDEDNYFEE